MSKQSKLKNFKDQLKKISITEERRPSHQPQEKTEVEFLKERADLVLKQKRVTRAMQLPIEDLTMEDIVSMPKETVKPKAEKSDVEEALDLIFEDKLEIGENLTPEIPAAKLGTETFLPDLDYLSDLGPMSRRAIGCYGDEKHLVKHGQGTR